MARLQDHSDKPATALDWTTLLDEYENAARDASAAPMPSEWANAQRRVDELRAEITNRVMRADMAYPGAQRILGGEPL